MAEILLIDDSSVQRRWLSRVLLDLQHQVHAAPTVAEALLLAEPEQVDLVLVELLMAGDNGFETGLHLRRTGFARVVLMSVAPRETDHLWARALGLTGVLARPQAPAALAADIMSFLPACSRSVVRE